MFCNHFTILQLYPISNKNIFPTLDHCMFTSCPFYGVCSVDKQGSTTCSCPRAYSCPNGPVCAMNGLTYGDECKMKLEACNKSKQLVVVHSGPCGK